jgi:hypothetical protein
MSEKLVRVDAAQVRADLAIHFRKKAGFRSEIAEQKCREGSGGQFKNELYAERLEDVAKYVEALPGDATGLKKIVAFLEAGKVRCWPPEGLHTDTIHCNYSQIGVASWFELWADDALAQANRDYERGQDGTCLDGDAMNDIFGD